MAGGFLSRLFGSSDKKDAGSSSGNRAGPWAAAPQQLLIALGTLDDYQKGLAKRAAGYITTGNDRPVLAEIEARRKTYRRPQTVDRDYHARQNAIARAQTHCFYNMGGDPGALARLAEVMTAQSGAVRLQYVLTNNTKLDSPEPVVTLLNRAAQRPHGMTVEQVTPTGLGDFLGAIEILGGRAADVLIFGLARRYGTRLALGDGKAVAPVLLDRLPIDEVIYAFQAMDAPARASAMATLRSHPRATDPELIPYFMSELGAGSAKVREAARLLLMKQDAAQIEPFVIEALAAGKAAIRTEAAILAGEIGSDALKAALQDRREVEKTSSILAIVDQYTGQGTSVAEQAAAPEGSYIAADGTTVTAPEFVPLPEDNSPVLDESDRKALVAAREAQNKSQLDRFNERLKQAKEAGHDTSKWQKPVPIGKQADEIFDWLSSGRMPEGKDLQINRLRNRALFYGYAGTWLNSRFERLPLKRQLQIAAASQYTFSALFSPYRPPLLDALMDRAGEGDFDLRNLIQEGRAMGANVVSGLYNNREERRLTSKAVVETYLEGSPLNLPDAAVWPVFVDYLDLLIDALPPRTTSVAENMRALRALRRFPKLPALAVQPVLFAAISERRQMRDLAQQMLADVGGIDDRLIEVLGDKRQAVRGNAARFLADRGCEAAIAPLKKRLKTEKSESARAEMISALARLGADTAPYLGQKALVAEAEKLAAKLPDAKIGWLPRAQAPALRWKDGKPAPEVLIDAWLKLALKLKEPAGSPLFGLYFDQLDASDVTAFADWLLSAWIAYDTDRGEVSELRERARRQAEQAKAQYAWYANQDLDQLTEMYLRGMLSSYPNSGTDAKGILALTHRGTPAAMSQRIQAYLKNHGKRVSQAKSLVEVLAATGTPEALQVLVATATRFKQRTVRELAEQLVGEIAAERGWSEDELADRSVPSGGFEEDGTLELEVGEESKLYLARLGEDLSVKLYNPEGKAVKNLPAGKDANTKEAKALLSAAKKAVKTVTAQQADRLYGAMVAERRWRRQDWQDDIAAHPIVRRLTERVIWLGLDADGGLVTTLRPTPEGDLLTAEGDDADMSGVAQVGIAHTSHLDEDARQAWLDHMKDFEVTPLFPQIARPMQVLSEAQKTDTALKDREGWLMESLKLRGMTTKAGFDRGPIEDGAGFNTYVKPFRSAGLTAVLEFTGSYVPEDNIPAAIREMRFVKGDGAYGRVQKLGDVPPILLSEVWADLYQIAEGGAYDPEWQKKGLY